MFDLLHAKSGSELGDLVWLLLLVIFATFDVCYELAVAFLMLVPAYDTHRRNLRQDVELVVGG